MMNPEPQPYHIVVLDDVQTSAKLIRFILEKNLHCTVQTSNNSKEFFELTKDRYPDLCLVDLHLEGETGIEVCYRLWKDPAKRDIPVFFFSSYGSPKTRVSALKAGGVDYLDKPFYPEELVTRVKTHLALYHTRLELQRQVEEQLALLRVLSHDLRNPVSGAYTMLELMQEDFEPSEEIDLAFECCKRALELIQHVGQQGALLDAENNLEMNPVKIREALGESVSVLRTTAQKKQILMNLEAPEDLEAPLHRVTFCHSIINNLLHNAIKFSYPESEIKIRAYESNVQGMLGAEIEIRDFGVGMTRQDLESLNQACVVESRRGTLNERGRGFGMRLVRRYVSKMGGVMTLDSVEEAESTDENPQGTRVVLFFPFTPVPKTPPPAEETFLESGMDDGLKMQEPAMGGQTV